MENYNQDCIMSYPRSGNHLVRFFVELLSETPTEGCKCDITSIYKEKFIHQFYDNNVIHFNIIDNECKFYKTHSPNGHNYNKLILIIRNPFECIIRHTQCYMDYKNYNDIFLNNVKNYFDLIDEYLTHDKDKIILFYEDMLSDKQKFINELYHFLVVDKPDKLAYVLNNIDFLWEQSLNPSIERKTWGGNNSSQALSYYFEKIENKNIKNNVMKTILEKLSNKNYQFIYNKYEKFILSNH
jgi:hypothetical protein